MQILLVRHGDAVLDSASDATRPLSVLGEDQSRIVGKAMMRLDLHPDIILCSPLLRARQMAAIIGEILTTSRIAASEYLVPGTDHRQLIDQLNSFGLQTALLVGHEPHLHNFLSLLTTDNQDLEVHFGNGTLACADVRMPIHSGAGVLRFLMTVEHLGMMV